MKNSNETLKMLALGDYDGLLKQQNQMLNQISQPNSPKFTGYQGLDPMTKSELLTMYTKKARGVLANFSLKNITECFIIYDNLNHINQLAIDITHENRTLSLLFFDQNNITTLETDLDNKTSHLHASKRISYHDDASVEDIAKLVKTTVQQTVDLFKQQTNHADNNH